MAKEKDFQSRFSKWLKFVYRHTGAFELKLARGDSLPFSAVAPHQIEALMHVRDDGLVYKIPDMGYQVPFDCFALVSEMSFIVIKYSTFFCLIEPEAFILERDILSKRKSLTSERARAISYLTVED